MAAYIVPSFSFTLEKPDIATFEVFSFDFVWVHEWTLPELHMGTLGC